MADFKEQPILSEDEENNIPLNQSQNSTKDKEILVEVVHEIQPLVPTEENATECGISPQSDNIITGRNSGVICDLLEDSRVPDPTFQNSSKTIIIPDENGSNESSEEKFCSLVHNEEGANRTGEEDIFCDPCLYGDMKTKATHYCKTCDAPEPLCNDCAKQHTRQKSSRNHEICDDIGEFQINQNDLNANGDQTDQEEVFCDPCLYGNIKTQATQYCKTCDDPEPLCNDCAKQHTRQKSNRDHELCDDMDEFHLNKKKMNANGDQTDQEVFCDPCLYGDIKTKATHYCKTCDDPEPLCNDCAKQHTRQKSNRDHELCDDMREFSNIQKDLNANTNKTDPEEVFCGPCLCGDIKTKATYYCKTCDDPEPLCNDCTKQHTRQKSSRDHELCDDMREFSNIQKDFNVNTNKTDPEEVFCDPCLCGDIKTKATHFCKTCEDPEPLCNDCAKQHTRQKSSKDHELCDDMREFSNIQKDFNVNADQTDPEEVFCDPCLCGDIKSKATHYCATCDDPEPLCNDCAKQHTRQKSSRDHELCDDLREFSNIPKKLNAKQVVKNGDQTDQEEVFCGPCLYGDIKTKATHYCKTCDVPEPLCNNCGTQHTRQKMSRDHELCDDMGKFSNNQKDLNAK